MNNYLEVAYPQSGSFCSGPGRIGIWKCLVCERFDSWLVKTRNVVLYLVLQQ